MQHKLLILILSLTSTSGCRPNSSPAPNEPGVKLAVENTTINRTHPAQASTELNSQLGLNIQISPKMPPEKLSLLIDSLLVLKNRELRSPTGTPTAYFKAFGGNNTPDALRFIGERVHYFFPETSELAFSTHGLVAANQSLLYWFGHAFDSTKFSSIEVDGLRIEPLSSRVGILQLGDDFLDEKLPAASRMAMIIHEARHSDCVGGITRNRLAELDSSPDLEHFLKNAEGQSCGAFHVTCPDGNPLAGQVNCDSRVWEAWTFTYILSRELFLRCTNCGTEEVQGLASLAVLSATRILPLPPKLYNSSIQILPTRPQNSQDPKWPDFFRMSENLFQWIDIFLNNEAGNPDLNSQSVVN